MICFFSDWNEEFQNLSITQISGAAEGEMQRVAKLRKLCVGMAFCLIMLLQPQSS